MASNMRQTIRKIFEGGRVRPPSLLTAPIGSERLVRAFVFAALCLAVGVAAGGQAHRRQQRPPLFRRVQSTPPRRQNSGDRSIVAGSAEKGFPPRREPLRSPPRKESLRPPLDRVAQELLRKMIRPTSEYAGEMVTQVAAQSNFPLQQTIKGDKQGRTLVNFLNGKLQGDVLMVTPGEVRNYHRSTGVMDVAQWPTEWDDHEKRMFAAIRGGYYTARVVGTEQVAGRQASIVELLPVAGAGEPGRPQFKFWIDQETGVQLKNEKSDAMGRVLSHRYLTSVTIGPNVVTPQDFNLGYLKQAQIRPLFPPNSQYRSLEQAQGHLPFTPVAPASLPSGFHLGGVWVFPGGNGQMQFVLLRYTDEVTSFSLYERIVPTTAKPPPLPAFHRHIERWRMLTSHDEIEATYTGMLTVDQVHDIYYSLH